MPLTHTAPSAAPGSSEERDLLRRSHFNLVLRDASLGVCALKFGNVDAHKHLPLGRKDLHWILRVEIDERWQLLMVHTVHTLFFIAWSWSAKSKIAWRVRTGILDGRATADVRNYSFEGLI